MTPGTVHYRGFADNDAVLLYFHPRDLAAVSNGRLQTMEIGDPDAAVERIVRDATSIFGHAVRDMVDGLERREVRVERKTLSFRTLNGFRAKTRAMGVRAVALPEVRLFGPPRADLPANTLALDPRNSVRPAVRVLGSMSTAAMAPSGAQLIGVALPPLGSEERTALDDYLTQLLRRRSTQFIRFTPARPGRSGPPRGLALIPDEQVVLNYELIRQGLARYDASDPAVAITFPELPRAAQQALDAGTGFAGRWRHDEAYRRSLQPPSPGRTPGAPSRAIRPNRPSVP